MRATASAPGKLILFGEHAVVHQQPAVCAALSDLRIYVQSMATNDGYLTVHMPDLESRGVSHYKAPVHLLVLEESQEIPTLQLEQILLATGLEGEFAVHALAPVIYLANQLVPSLLKEGRGLEVRVNSTSLPVSAGLGSSAAFSVACTASLYKLQKIIDNSFDSSWDAPSQETLELLNNFAFKSEQIIHGTPSGIDNTVSCYGGAILFCKNVNGNIHKEFLGVMPSLNILLTNTSVPRSTKALVSRVRHFKETFPEVAQGILDACGAISRSFHKLLIEYSETRKFNDENLDTLILTNQGLLRTLGVSHESLEEICRITRQFGAETKLTGAGGGGCAFTFIKAASEYPKEEIQRALEASPFGFKCMESSVGGIGVRWEESMPTRETNNNSKLCIL